MPMAEQTVTGIVVRRRDSGESDRKITIVTAECGRVDAIAKGARKAASRLAGSSEPLTVARFTLAEGRSTRFVTQAEPITSFPHLRRDYDRLALALGLAEFFAHTTVEGMPTPESFDTLHAGLAALETHENPIAAMVWALSQALELEGVWPDWIHCAHHGTEPTVSPCFVAPSAGGFVCDQCPPRHSDGIWVRSEVLIGLARIAELNAPPTNFKFASEALYVTVIFAIHNAHAALPALQSALEALHIHSGGVQSTNNDA